MKQLIVFLFFLLFLIVGVFVFKDYGVSWDENFQRNTGLLTTQLIFERDQSLYAFVGKYYGTAFEMVLIFFEELFGLDTERNIYLSRHLATFALFFLSVIFFFKICRYHHP